MYLIMYQHLTLCKGMSDPFNNKLAEFASDAEDAISKLNKSRKAVRNRLSLVIDSGQLQGQELRDAEEFLSKLNTAGVIRNESDKNRIVLFAKEGELTLLVGALAVTPNDGLFNRDILSDEVNNIDSLLQSFNEELQPQVLETVGHADKDVKDKIRIEVKLSAKEGKATGALKSDVIKYADLMEGVVENIWNEYNRYFLGTRGGFSGYLNGEMLDIRTTPDFDSKARACTDGLLKEIDILHSLGIYGQCGMCKVSDDTVLGIKPCPHLICQDCAEQNYPNMF